MSSAPPQAAPLRVDEARALVLAASERLEAESVPVVSALDRTLAEPVRARADVPAHANSAMDGFAVRAGPAGRRLRVIDESRAGRPARRSVGAGDAIAISTGALLPEGADGVCPIEQTRAGSDAVELLGEVSPGQHVRYAGEDLRQGARVLEPGVRLGPAELGLAVASGRGAVRCARRPRLALLTTGDELAAPGAALSVGQVHDTNAVTLAGQGLRAGADVIDVRAVADRPAETRLAIAEALRRVDVLVVSGGISVGDHDHVKDAFDELGVRCAFWRVALKPGKPTWFGTRERTLVFGLPGNPVSAMVCFTLFVSPALRALQGAAALAPTLPARLAAAVRRSPQREQAVRVSLTPRRDGWEARPTGPQGSHLLSSTRHADGLARIEAGSGELPAGSPVEVERWPE